MSYETHKAIEEAEAAAWLEDNGHELEPVVEVGQDVGNALRNPRPKSDAQLLRDDVTNTVRERSMVKGIEKVRKESKEPTDDLANSMADPDLLGFYACGRGEAKAANKARAYHGIEYVLDGAGRVRGGKSGKTRETKAEKRARLANRYQCAVVEYRHTRDSQTPAVVFEGSREECFALANSMADEFRCAAVRFSDGRCISAFPEPYLSHSREASEAFEMRDPNWRALMR